MVCFNNSDDEIPAYRGKYPAPKPLTSQKTGSSKEDGKSAPQPDVTHNPPKDPTDEQMKDAGNYNFCQIFAMYTSTVYLLTTIW